VCEFTAALILNLELDGVERSTSYPGRLTSGDLLTRSLGEHPNRSGSFGDEINLLPLLGFEPLTVHSVGNNKSII
jgi:hypothetical protein